MSNIERTEAIAEVILNFRSRARRALTADAEVAHALAAYIDEIVYETKQARGAVVVTDAGIVRAERWMLNEMHDGLTNRECIDAILNALRGQ